MTFSAEITADAPAQAVIASAATADQLGTSGSNISVAAGVASTQSDPAPRDGIVVVALNAGMSCRIRKGTDPTAIATDPLYMGPNVWHFPIRRNERLSFFGDAGITTANITVAMAE